MAFPPSSGIGFVPTHRKDIYPAINPTISSLSQPSKVVLISGAGRGIGHSISLRYAESGVACIVICSRTTSELDQLEQDVKKINSSIKVKKFTLDITDDAAVLSLAEAIKKEEGRLDVLINNAATSAPWVPLADSIPKKYWRTWTVNFQGTYLMVHHLLPLMIETASKHKTITDIVNVSSYGAHFTIPGASSYQISKFAINRLSEFVAVEYGDKGINCMALHPGSVLTTLSDQMPENHKWTLTDTSELAGGFIVWLTKGQRTWLNGRYVSVNWDVDELEARKEEIVKGDKLKYRMVV